MTDLSTNLRGLDGELLMEQILEAAGPKVVPMTLGRACRGADPGIELWVKTIAAQTVVSASSNVVPLAGGAAGIAILAATTGKWSFLKSNGTNWEIMAAP
ncbi:MAG: hypothetical protein WAV72_02155 [Bradyrhizobium sp.]